MNVAIEKKAQMSEEEKAKYIKATIAAGLGAAGIGAIIRNYRAKKSRAKIQNTAKSKNAIVIPVKKTKFLEELPTPEELAESRGETAAVAPAQVENKADVPALPAPGAAAPAAELTPEEIAAKKKEILRANAHKFDFFGKAATAKQAEETKTEPKDDAKTEEKAEEKKTETSEASDPNSKKEERTFLRDQEGKFVSPTDPVGVAAEEKNASFFGEAGDIVLHPLESGKKVLDAATGKPVWTAAGMVGSFYLAAKITDAINERRRQKAKERLARAQDQYVELLEKEEKQAQDDSMRNGAGMVLGGAFFIPLALSALVTNKIIENRKIDKKREKEMSDSYPDEPVIMYKTSEAKEFPISVETALGMILYKTAAMKHIERESGFCKSALPLMLTGFDHQRAMDAAQKANNAVRKVKENWNTATPESAMDDAVAFIKDPKNSGLVLDMVKAYGPGGTAEDQNRAMGAMGSQMATMKNWVNGNGKIWSDPGFKAKLMSDPRVYNHLAYQFNNDDKYKAYRDEMIDHEIGKTFSRDGVLHKIVSWFVKTFGIGASKFNTALKQQLGTVDQAPTAAKNEPAAQTAPATQTAPAAAKPPSAPAAAVAPAAPKTPAAPAVRAPAAPKVSKPVATPNANTVKNPFDVKAWNETFRRWRNGQ